MSGEGMTARFDLGQLREQGDTELDAIITRMGRELDGFHTMVHLFPRIHDLMRMELHVLDELRRERLVNEELIEFINGFNQLPDRDWIDRSALGEGGKFYRDHGVLGFLVLACASLPACYSWQFEAHVLGYTGKLSRKRTVPRRIPETAQFVIDVVAPHAFEPHGTGIRATQKIRLIHAIIRYLIVRPDSVDDAIRQGVILPDPTHGAPGHHHENPWKPFMGAPISQELMAGTLMTFSYVVLKGLRKLSVRASAQEVQGYIHRWNVAGYLLGMDEQVLRQVQTLDDAEELFCAVVERNRRQSDHGYHLEAALLSYMRNNLLGRFTGWMIRPLLHLPAIMTRGLAGKETSQAVSLKLNAYELFWYAPIWFGMRLIGFLNNFALFSWLTGRIINWVSMRVWGWSRDEQVSHQADIDSGAYRPDGEMVIPSALLEDWGLTSAAQPSSSRK